LARRGGERARARLRRDSRVETKLPRSRPRGHRQFVVCVFRARAQGRVYGFTRSSVVAHTHARAHRGRRGDNFHVSTSNLSHSMVCASTFSFRLTFVTSARIQENRCFAHDWLPPASTALAGGSRHGGALPSTGTNTLDVPRRLVIAHCSFPRSTTSSIISP
jgi:hypothetical protein